MNIENLKKYLETKEEKSSFEKTVLQALKDENFLDELNQLSFLENYGQANNVINNPSSYDTPGNNRYYDGVLVHIVNAFTSYNYDAKTKFTNFNNQVDNLNQKIADADTAIDNIKKTSEIISGAEVLSTYAGEFKSRADKYGIEADKWVKKLFISYLVLACVIVTLLFINLFNVDFFKKYLSEETLHFGYAAIVFIKIIIIAIIIQLVRFFSRNYNANKHLETQSLHKYDVLKSLQGVYNTLDEDEKEARSELIKTGAITAFQNTESGYITTKEGAGGSDAGVWFAITDILKK